MVNSSKSDIGPLELLYSGADSLLSAVQSSINIHSVNDFFTTVKWDEPFIYCLLCFQICLFLLTFITRKRDGIQFSILIVITIMALFAERLNTYGKRNWIYFATQDYFDSAGLFMLVFVSGPFLILANFIVIGMTLRLFKLYAKKKRRELARKSSTPSESSGVKEKKHN